jgi:hypothetical protein
MSISYPLALPSSPPGFRTFEMIAHSAVGMSVSPFTGSQQTYEWPGTWWTLKASLPPMRRADAERWISFLLSLHGRAGTFVVGDPMGKVPRGVATGVPKVNGANQVGSSLVTDGWTNSITNILRAGDYIQIGAGANQRLYKNLKDVNSGATTGPATLDIFPRLRESPADNATIVVASAAGLFRLAMNDPGWTVDVAQTYGIGLEAQEAF